MNLLLIWMDKQKIKIKILIGLGYRAKIGVGYVVHYPFSCKTVIDGNYLVVIGACCSESTLN